MCKIKLHLKEKKQITIRKWLVPYAPLLPLRALGDSIPFNEPPTVIEPED